LNIYGFAGPKVLQCLVWKVLCQLLSPRQVLLLLLLMCA
jgi:hypothetical protein